MPAKPSPAADVTQATCTRCRGTGHSSLRATSACWCCQGRGSFSQPDASAILTAIAGRKGGLRSAKPNDSTETGRRAAYVWRWARFHGGADVCIPCTVSADGDPWAAALEVLTDQVAKAVFGTNLAAAYRWGALLGAVKPGSTPAGLPATSYENGPVADGKDPETVAMLVAADRAGYPPSIHHHLEDIACRPLPPRQPLPHVSRASPSTASPT